MKQMNLGCSLLLLLLTSLVQAQHTLAVPVSLEHAIKEHAPEWNLIFVSIRKSKEENNTHFRWKHEDREVGVFVNEYESIEESRITPNSLLTQAPRKQEKIEGIGDEAYLLGPASYGARRVNVIFRKGKLHVDVEAPSIDVAQLFAKHLADALPTAKE
jgi:hypothetical protein